MRYARCKGCLNFYITSALHRIECPACVFTTYCCAKCLGLYRAARSVYGHAIYWSGRGGEDGGHNQETRAELKKQLQRLKEKHQ